MVVHLSWRSSLALDVAVWLGWGIATGYAARRLPSRWLEAETRVRPWDLTAARLLRIRLWQRHLPEAGRIFGGVDKRTVGGRSTEALTAYAAETRRGEAVHWLGLGVVPLFALWNAPGLFAAMVVYAVVANGPCLLSLRYNRRRVGRVLARRAGRGPAVR